MDEDIMEEDNVQVAAEKGWKTFERYAREIMRRYYAQFRLDIKDTPWSHDGGRDGDAVYIFAPTSSETAKDLDIIVRLWVEVKLRTHSAVSLHDTGSHLIRAENQKVNKLIFVTNRSFARETREQINLYCMNRQLSCAFIDGARLEDLRVCTSVPGSLQTEPAPHTVPVASMDVLVRLSNDPLPRDMHPRAYVCCRPEAPVFLVLDIAMRGDLSTLSMPVITPPTTVERCVVYWSTLAPPLIDGERFRVVYAVWGRPSAVFRPEDFGVTFQGVPDGAVSMRFDAGTVTVGPRFLLPQPLASQEGAASSLRKALDDWLSANNHTVYAIEAPAGVGKSFVVQELRHRWLEQQVREIWLDGGCHSDAWSVVVTLFAALFPLTGIGSTNQGEHVLERWLVDVGINDAVAVKAIVRLLTSDASEAPPDRGICVAILSSLLRHASAQHPIVVVYEDLHKASASAILLIHSLLSRIGHEGAGNSFILVTTRPPDHIWTESQSAAMDSEAGPGAFGEPLSRLLAHLAQDGKVLFMERPKPAQARALLATSLPYAEPVLLEAMIDQVGTTPFALKELMAYLATMQALESVGDGSWSLIGSSVLRSRPERDDFRNATIDRVGLLLRKWEATYPWLDDFLLAGALLGRHFPVSQALEAVEAPFHLLPSSLLDLLFSADVAQPGRFDAGSEQLRFTHDLIRGAFLDRRPWTASMRLAGRLLRESGDELPLFLRCRLARNAGDADLCRSLAEVGYAQARNAGLHWDSLQFRLLSLWALDPARASQLLDESRLMRFITVDPALKIGPDDTVGAPARAEIVVTLLDCLDSLVSIGFGGGKSVDSLMAETEMLLRFAGDRGQKARLDNYAGRFAFDADNFPKSLKRHSEAEVVYAALDEPILLGRRLDNLNRVFLCQRQLDLIEEARATLALLELLGAGSSDEFPARMLAHWGYLRLYHEISVVPEYWQRASEISRAAGNDERFVHHAIGHAYALLLLDRLHEAAQVFAQAETVLMRGPKLQGKRLRLDLDAGALALVRQDWGEAEARLFDALNQGLQLDVYRRLWRIEANIATLQEAIGDIGKCEFYDRRAIRGILVRAKAEESLAEAPPWLRQRHVLPALNLALRIRAGSSACAALDNFTTVQKDEISRLANLVEQGRLSELPSYLGYHCKLIAGRPRFILTE